PPAASCETVRSASIWGDEITVRLVYGERTDPGRVRPSNQDAYLFEPLSVPGGGALLAVADGMGGYDGGEVASRLAIQTLRAYVPPRVEAWVREGSVGEGLVEAIHEANHAILQEQMARAELAHMGTTVTAVVVMGPRLYVGHVGDSKAFLVGPREARQITSDHNVPGELLQSGHLTREEAANHPQRHVLTRALGVRPDLPVEQRELEWAVGDLLLLCTDGLSNLVALEEIREAALRLEPDALAEWLVNLANSRGGYDNITVLAARWEG
ncbi:Stp1/IreP family PP2C-type Ser/Thr phosphatase, partial [Symbiobacterium thermophilum]